MSFPALSFILNPYKKGRGAIDRSVLRVYTIENACFEIPNACACSCHAAETLPSAHC